MALVVMVPVFAQAHAAHDHAGPAEPVHVHKAAAAHAVAAMPLDVASVVATDVQGDRADCAACPSCCCGHVFVTASVVEAGRADRLSGRRVAMGPDTARPSALAEALPEPPRPFA